MEPASPTSLSSHTFVIDSGIDLATSISAATSTSGECVALGSQDISTSLLFTNKDQHHTSVSEKQSLKRHRSVSVDSLTQNHEHSAIVNVGSDRQSPFLRSMYRIWRNEMSDGDCAQGRSSGGESHWRKTLPTDYPIEESADAKDSSTASAQETTSLQRVASIGARKTACALPQSSFFLRRCPGHLQCVSIPPLLVPKSRYSGWGHSLPVSDERSALSRILQANAEYGDRSLTFHDILLEDFVIYRPGSQTRYPWQMVTLDTIVSSYEACKYLLNGVLRCGELAEYIEAVEIDIDAISIDGFEDPDVHSTQNKIFLQTVICARRRHQALKCWYRLGEPSGQYQHLHKKFLWVADLAKHVIDYLDWMYMSNDGGSLVRLENFRSDFLKRLMQWHGGDISFQRWLGWYGGRDFRIPINRHREFIFSRVYHMDGHYLKHDLWSELMVRPMQSLTTRTIPVADTIVTPYIHHCCQWMGWSRVLEVRAMSSSVLRARKIQANRLGFSSNAVYFSPGHMAAKVPDTALALERAAESGSFTSSSAEEALDRFAILRMKQATRNAQSYNYTFAYIQGTVKDYRETQLKVIFIYLPSETICLDAYYPRSKELFLSDTCNCSADGEPILLTDIICFINVNVGAHVNQHDGFFIRQKYVESEDAICTIRESDLRCPCRRPRYDVRQPQSGESKPPLRGLSLFTGCGNFDLGLEASGAIKFTTAIDINEFGLKSYAANRAEGLRGLMLESVNPCLAQILQGSQEFPSIGSIQCLVGGCPCQGFSMANANRHTDKSLRNCSLLASTLSYIETYLPQIALIENVKAISFGAGNSGNQAIACLVGLGYQVRKLQLNCCRFSSPQSRERFFILAAAPDVPLPKAPIPSKYPDVKASAVSRDLPEIDNDDLICVPYPDHIPGVKQTPILRELVRRVPRFPKKMNFMKSIQAGSQGPEQLDWVRKREYILKVQQHNAFERLDPDAFIPTITTAPRPRCGRGGGKIIHWDQHRTLTLLEARRAQGFPDDEVIIGDLSQQWAQVGNAVNRQVATALGKVIADSWFSKPLTDEAEVVVAIPAHQNPNSWFPKPLATEPEVVVAIPAHQNPNSWFPKPLATEPEVVVAIPAHKNSTEPQMVAMPKYKNSNSWFPKPLTTEPEVVVAIPAQKNSNPWFSKPLATKPEIVIAIPAHKNSSAGNDASRPAQSPFTSEPYVAANDALHDSFRNATLADQIQTETEALVGGTKDVHQDTSHSRRGGASTMSVTKDKHNEGPGIASGKGLRSRNVDRDVTDWLKFNNLQDDEVEFVKQTFGPKPHSHSALDVLDRSQDSINARSLYPSFSQIQRRRITTLERNSRGEEKAVRMLAERRIELRPETSASSSRAVEYGSSEHPIDLEVEVSVSKRRRNESLDDGNESGGIKNWVGRRVRSRLNG